MAGREIIVRILGDASSFTKATKDASASAGKFSNVLSGVGMGLGISSFNLMGDAVTKVTGYLTDAVSMAREEEVGIARLGASLKANVEGWDGNTDAIEKNIGAMVRTTGFSDGDMRDSLARLVGATKDVGKAFDIQRVAMDLARFRGISLADASDALIKVEAGQYRALKGLGIVLKEGATQTEALAAVQKVAGGQMAAFMDTAAGKSEVLKNRMEDLQESIGVRLTPALEDLTDTLLGFMDALDSEVPMEFDTRVKTLAGSLRDTVPILGDVLQSAFEMGQGFGSSLAGVKRSYGDATTALNIFRQSERDSRGAVNDATVAIRSQSGALQTLRTGLSRTGAEALEMVDDMIAVRREAEYLWGLSHSNPGFNKKRKKKKPKHTETSTPVHGDGGWVGLDGPELGILGDEGPEYIIPNNKLRSASGGRGGLTVHVHGNIYGPSGVDELMDMMARRLRLDGV